MNSTSPSESGDRPAPSFDAQRARLSGPDLFNRFRVKGEGEPLHSAGLRADELLLVVDRDDHQLAFTARQMNYHHAAQGKLAGEPYLVSF